MFRNANLSAIATLMIGSSPKQCAGFSWSTSFFRLFATTQHETNQNCFRSFRPEFPLSSAFSLNLVNKRTERRRSSSISKGLRSFVVNDAEVLSSTTNQRTTSPSGSVDGSVRRISARSKPWTRLSLRGEDEKERTAVVGSLLVCGDGDLSFSSSIATELRESSEDHQLGGVFLTATVLEDEETHEQVYKNSRAHRDVITRPCGDGRVRHTVRFGVDATKLEHHFDARTTSFDRIQFNFPHRQGKNNNKYNRQLLSDFLGSAAKILSPDGGEIHVALCDGQGGSSATSAQKWRQSWMAAQFAAEHGLLLADVSPFKPEYDLSSYMGTDRAFRVGKSPKLYKFVPSPHRFSSSPDDGDRPPVEIPTAFQLSCRHELHVILPSNDDVDDPSRLSVDEIVRGDAVLERVRDVLPDGVRVEIPLRDVVDIPKQKRRSDNNDDDERSSFERLAVFLMVYSGEGRSITRAEADEFRETAETAVSEIADLRPDRRGRLVSRPFPYPLLGTLVEDYLATTNECYSFMPDKC